jgi:hypothetical protein
MTYVADVAARTRIGVGSTEPIKERRGWLGHPWSGK